MPDPQTVDELLAEARADLERLTPAQARDAIEAGAALVDIRSDSQRERDGVVPGARFVPRNVLEWRLDALARANARVILMCDEGYQSSLAAATARRLGVDATDLDGGFQGWRASGLPVEPL